MKALLFLILVSTAATTYAKNDKYDRKQYRHWIDTDKDCQNTQQETLIEYSIEEPIFKTDKQCRVTAGQWFDPYSGKLIFLSKEIDIDHIIPLKAAHGMGAKKWTKEEKKRFSNDPINLIPVSAKLNRQKGTKSPISWLPPNQTYRCDYLVRWLKVSKKYDLKLATTQKEVKWIRTKIHNCNEKRVPASVKPNSSIAP